jgi:hypothetical protein
MNRGHNKENLFWVRVPVRMVSVAWKLSTAEEWRLDKDCFGEEIAGTKVTNRKSVMVSSPGEDVRFRDNLFL